MKSIEARGHVVPVVEYTGTRFDGDGRRWLDALPQDVHPSTKPLRVRRSTARQVIHHFESMGFTVHSGQGAMVWIVIEWCRLRGIKYTLDGSPGNGFYIKKLGAVTSGED